MSLLLLVLAACGPAPEPPPVRPHLVLVTLDTTRADRLGAYGYAGARTDTLDALARAGRRYARAYAPVPLTIPSHATLLTGKGPGTHGLRRNGGGALAPEHVTLAEVLRDAGYATAASVGAFVTTRTWGFDQGFDAYFDTLGPTGADNFWQRERRADAVIDDLLRWKAEQGDGRPQLVWAHLYDPHHPYAPPEGYVDPADPRPYDGELAFVDDQIGRLVAAYAGTPTLFVVAADHGESLGEHGEATHGLFVYDATARVPLVIAGPGVEPAVIDEPTGLVDVLPTLLGLLGLPVPAGVEGVVRPTGAASPPPVHLESWQLAERFGLAPHVGLVDGVTKLVDLPRPELYDLAADPGEVADRAAADPARVAAMRAALAALSVPPPAPSSTSTAPAAIAALEALGYVAASQPLPAGVDLPDPKDHAALLAAVQRLDAHPEEAEGLLRGLVAAYPTVLEFTTRLATVLVHDGRLAEAAPLVEAGLAIAPDHVGLRSFRASQLAHDGRFAEAGDAFAALAEAQPFHPRLRALAIGAWRHAGEGERALTQALAWRSAFADDVQLAGALGVLLAERGQVERARPLLESGLRGDPPEPEVAWQLASLEVAEGRLGAACDRLRVEVAHHPGNVRAALALARLGSRLQRWDDQLTGAVAATTARPRDPEAWWLRVLALFNLARYPEAREALRSGLAVDPAHPDLLLMDANLLSKEGRKDEGARRFEEAKRALAARATRSEAGVAEALGLPAAGVPATDRPPWDEGRSR